MCLVGSLGIFVQFITYNVLREYFQFSPFDASQIAVCTAIINNFFLNSKITFSVKNKLSWTLKIKRLLLFTIYSVFIINLQSYWLRLGVLCFGPGPLRENIIMAMGIGLISLLNYYTYSRHIWAEKYVPSN